jgi:uncharacterized protein YukE
MEAVMPDTLGARIAVPPELAESGAQIIAIGIAIDVELTGLTALLAPLAEAWTGAAAAGHEDVQSEWNTASRNLMTDVGTLGALGHASNTNWTNYVETEAANLASWRH